MASRLAPLALAALLAAAGTHLRRASHDRVEDHPRG